jgi:hypothetical protein
MRYPRTIAVLACLFSWACIDLPEIQQVSEVPDAGDTWDPDAHIADSGTQADSGIEDDPGTQPDASTPDAGTSTLTVTLVTSRSVTNSDVQVRATVTGAPPDEVKLLVDGVAVATLNSPYELRWSAQSLEEGTHVLSVRAAFGERSFTSESRTLIVDRTPPQILSRVPSPGAEGVAVRDPIRATFDEPLDAATLTEASIQLRAGSTVLAHTAMLSDDGRTMTVSPSVSLGAPGTMTLALTPELSDLAGNPLLLPEDAWVWSLPESFVLGTSMRVNAGATNAVSPVIRQDMNANLVLAWSEEDGTSRNVYVQRRKNGAWIPLGGALSANAGGNTPVSGAALQLDDQGNPTVAWVEGNGGSVSSIYVRRWDGQDWKPLGEGLTATIYRAVTFAAPALRLDKQGLPIMAWSESDGSRYNLFVYRWTGTGWFPVGEGFTYGSQSAGSPSLDLDSQGNPVVAFIEQLDGVRNVHVRWRQSGTWKTVGAPFEFPSGTQRVSAPIVRMGRDDHPVIAWIQEVGMPSTATGIHVVKWDGDSWEFLGDALSAHPGGTIIQSYDLQLDAQGHPILTWSENDSAGLADVYIQQWDGMDWKPVGGAVSALPGSTSALSPSLSLDGNGVPTIAWAEYDGTANSINVLQYNH